MKVVRAWVGVTDDDWYRFLAARPTVREVDFWQPSGGHEFHVLAPGEPFFFKTHYPHNKVVGGGVLQRLGAPAGLRSMGPVRPGQRRRQHRADADPDRLCAETRKRTIVRQRRPAENLAYAAGASHAMRHQHNVARQAELNKGSGHAHSMANARV